LSLLRGPAYSSSPAPSCNSGPPYGSSPAPSCNSGPRYDSSAAPFCDSSAGAVSSPGSADATGPAADPLSGSVP
jgi:hypothetical protein